MTEPTHTSRIRVADDVALHVREWTGDGVCFVLLHGLASNARLWDGVAGELAAAGHRVVAVDQRGHGRADKPDDGYDMTTVTDDLAQLLDALSADRPVVVGQSWGGNVVVEFAARFPGVARGIGCVDGGAIALRREFPDWDRCAELLRPPALAGTPVALIERWLRDAHPDWPEAGIVGTLANFEVRADATVAPWLTLERHLAVLRGLWEHDPFDRFPHVTEPVLFLGAEPADGHRPARHAGVDEAVRVLTGAGVDARVDWLTGDHDLHAQHPVQVAARLRTLLRDRTHHESGETA